MLVLEANRILPVDRLVEAVWDQSAPSTAKAQVQICVSALRRVLTEAGLPGVITTRSPGYVLEVADTELDLSIFDRLTATARRARTDQRPAEAVTAYREALALWYGEPLAGLDSRLVRAAAVQVAEQIFVALEECIDLELQIGRHTDVVGELMTLVAEYPLRDRLRRHLMLALYRSGRQAEALAVYRKAREDFAEELGLEPSDALQRLERAILMGDASLDPPEPSPAEPAPAEPVAGPVPHPQMLPAGVADFVGRGKMVRELREMLAPREEAAGAQASERTGVPVVAIAGPGGVGKSALAVHLAHILALDFPDGQLFINLRGNDSRPVTGKQALERFLRSLGVAGTDIPEDAEERAAIYRGLLASRRALVVLDDVSDERQVTQLLPGADTGAVILTSRYRLTGLPGAHHVDLDVFDEAQAIGMLTAVIGSERVEAEPEAALALVNLCDRLPLALRIGAARLAARRHWPIAQLTARLADEDRRLDELVHRGLSVRPSIEVAYASLPARAQVLFRRLSVIDAPDFASWVAAPLLDADVVEAEDLLETIVDVRLLEAEHSAGRVRYRFHDLVRVYAAGRQATDEDVQERHVVVGRVVGAWLFLAEQAHQRQYGGDYTVLHGTAPRWEIPAGAAQVLVEDPLQWFESERVALVDAVRQAAEAGLDEACWDLAMTAVTLFEVRSYLDDWRETHEIALAAVRRAGNRRGEAAMRYSQGALGLVDQRLTDAGAHLAAALEIFGEVGDDHGRALALRNLAYLDRVRGKLDSALVRSQQALAGLLAVGDRIGEAHVLSSIAQIKLEQRDHDEAEELLTQSLEIARATGSQRMEAQALYRRGESRRGRPDLVGAEDDFRAVLRLVLDSADTVGRAYALYGLGNVHLQAGRHAQADTTLEQALRLAAKGGDRMLAARVELALGKLCVAVEQPDRAERRLTAAWEQFQRLGAVLWQARALVLLGRLHRAGGRERAAAQAFAEASRLREGVGHRAESEDERDSMPEP